MSGHRTIYFFDLSSSEFSRNCMFFKFVMIQFRKQ